MNRSFQFQKRSLLFIRVHNETLFVIHVYEVRRRSGKCGVDLISDVLPFGGLPFDEPNAVINAIGYAKFRSRSHRAVIRVYNE